MQTVLAFLHLFALVFWIGSIVFFSFFTAPAVFKTLERPLAGELIGVLFPRYYGIGYVASVVILATLLLGASAFSPVKLTCIGLMMACTFAGGLVVHPRARALKEQIESAPSEREQKPLQERFRKLHSVSVQLNATVLLAGLVLLWFTARGLTL